MLLNIWVEQTDSGLTRWRFVCCKVNYNNGKPKLYTKFYQNPSVVHDIEV